MKFGISREDVGRGRGGKWQVCLEGRVCHQIYFKLWKLRAAPFTSEKGLFFSLHCGIP